MTLSRYKNMGDDDWEDFGGALRWWANSEYEMMMQATTTWEHAVAELGLCAAVESLSRYLIVRHGEDDREIDMKEAMSLAYELIRSDYAEKLQAEMKL